MKLFSQSLRRLSVKPTRSRCLHPTELPYGQDIYFCRFHRKLCTFSFNLKIRFLNSKGSAAVQKLQIVFCVSVAINTEIWVKHAGTLVLKVSYLQQQWEDDRLASSTMSSLTCTIQVWHHHQYTLPFSASIRLMGLQKWTVWDWLTQKWNNVQYTCHRYYVSRIKLDNVINLASQVNLCG